VGVNATNNGLHVESPVKSETQAYPGKTVVKMGMMPRIPQPEVEGFSLHRHPWQGVHPDIESYKIKWAGPDKEKHERTVSSS